MEKYHKLFELIEPESSSLGEWERSGMDYIFGARFVWYRKTHRVHGQIRWWFVTRWSDKRKNNTNNVKSDWTLQQLDGVNVLCVCTEIWAKPKSVRIENFLSDLPLFRQKSVKHRCAWLIEPRVCVCVLNKCLLGLSGPILIGLDHIKTQG